MSDRRVTVLIPTLNEVENIDPLMERILSATKDNDFVVEIMVVDGGSTDGTQERVKEWGTKASVRLITSDGKGGLSRDIVYGGNLARTDVVVVMDADLSHPPEALPSMIRPILDGTHDMASGVVTFREGRLRGGPGPAGSYRGRLLFSHGLWSVSTIRCPDSSPCDEKTSSVSERKQPVSKLPWRLRQEVATP